MKSESEVAQSRLTLRDPMVCSLPGSSIRGIFQARVLEWGAIAFSVFPFRLLNINNIEQSSLCHTFIVEMAQEPLKCQRNKPWHGGNDKQNPPLSEFILIYEGLIIILGFPWWLRQ